MTDAAIAEFAARINAAGTPKGVLYVTGGGTEAFPMLLSRGGGSATLLSGRVLYARDDFRAALGCDPGQYVDARAARGLAMAAFRHALQVRGDLAAEEVFGIGSTSKLATGAGEREGRSHVIHAAFQASHSTHSWSIALPSGRDRAWEERINALFLLNLMGFTKVGTPGLALEHDGVEVPPAAVAFRVQSGEPAMAEVLVGRRAWVALDAPPKAAPPGPPAWTSDDQGYPRLLLPGSFRPLHEGHAALAEAASRLTGLDCGYEFSLFHPEKPPLDFLAIHSRLAAFEGRAARLYLTNAPTYLEKARLFPGCTFVVGHDTALRVVDPRFYGGPAARDAAMDELERLGARFLVFGRVDASGEFRDFRPGGFEHPVAGFLERVATPVPGHVFRLDLSSTEVRGRSAVEYD